MEKIADKINLESIKYITTTRVYTQQFRAGYAKSKQVIAFNKKTVELLGITKWTSAVAGYDSKTGIIVFRCAEPEEYGAVLVRDVKIKDKKLKKQIFTGGKEITINHLVSHGLKPVTNYIPERAGNVVLCEPVED